MSLKLGDGFSYLARKPLDERLVYNSIEDMANLSDSSLYTGIIAYNKETNAFYTFNENNPVDPTLGKWRDFFSTGTVSFTATVDMELTSSTYGHLLITLADGTVLDCGFILGGNVATIEEYKPNTYYDENALLFLGDRFGRTTKDYTTGSITTTIRDLFENDPNLVIMRDIIHDDEISVDKTYSSTKIENLISSISSSFLGSIEDDDPGSFPADGHEGNWCLVENCANIAPGQPGVAAYRTALGGWNVTPIPTGDFIFPEPIDDGKFYFRSRPSGASDGIWELFAGVNGNDYPIQIKFSSDSSLIPEKGELVWRNTENDLVLGDGTTNLDNLEPFYKIALTANDITSALGFTPENSLNKGQANGYAPLDANGLVPTANLPASLTDTYSKSDIDAKDAAALVSATTLVNTEAALARANEGQLTTDLTAHVTDTTVHVTQNEKDAWDAKVDTSMLTDYDNHLTDTIIHVTQSDKDKWNGMNKVYYVTNKNQLPTTDNSIGNLGYVQVSAAGVTPVVCDTYLWNGSEWLLQDAGGVSLQLAWGNISGTPSSTPLAIDNSVQIAHTHLNMTALDKIGQTNAGAFTYDGVEIGIRVVFVDNELMLPNEGEGDTLYVVYADTRVRNYPSISVWRDGAYQILGRGTQDAPQVVGDMSILQNEFFSVTSGSKFKITVAQNQYFAFLPLEILKEIPGATNQNRVISDFNDETTLDYDPDIITVTNEDKIKFNIASIPLHLDDVRDQYLFSSSIDLTKYKDITEVL